MGVLIAETDEGHSPSALKQILLDEISRQGVPFGIRILEATSGETATDAYNFQAFMGEVNLAAKVYPDGREEWVRGVNFVGTPLNAVRGILATGDRYAVDNAWCGAESGYVPVSTISPPSWSRSSNCRASRTRPTRRTPSRFPGARPRRGLVRQAEAHAGAVERGFGRPVVAQARIFKF